MMETLVYYDAIADIKKNKKTAIILFALGWAATVCYGRTLKHACFGLIIGVLLCASVFGIKHILKDLNDRKSTIYLIGLVLYTLIQVIFDTSFNSNPVISYALLILGAGLAALKIVLYDDFKGLDLIILILFIAISAGHWVAIGADFNALMTSEIIPVLLFILAAKDVDFEAILKVHFFVHFPVIIAALIAALPPFELIENVYRSSKIRGARYGLGTTHPTHIGGHVFFLLAIWLFLQRKSLKWYHYAVSAVAVVLMYAGSKTQLDLVCIAIMMLGFFVISLIEKMKNEKVKNVFSKIINWGGYVSAPIMATAITLMSYYYRRKNYRGPFWKRFSTLRKRFFLGRRALRKYPFTLFGNPKEAVSKYYLDSSYLHNYIHYGIILAVLAIILISYGCYRKRKDLYFSVLIIILSLNYFCDERMFWLGMNPFMLIILAGIGDISDTSS